MYHYKVILAKSGREGIGESVPQGLQAALGKIKYLKLLAKQPNRGFFWSAYLTQTLGSTATLKQTTPFSGTYETCGVFQDSNPGSPLIYTVYRAINPRTLEYIQGNEHTETPATTGRSDRNRKTEGA